MRIIRLIQKFVQVCLEHEKTLILSYKFKERQRQEFLHSYELKDWAKFESYFGNGRIF